MQQTITPEKQTVEICLKNKSYYIDFYQREYVWSKETVEILLRDIFYAFELSYEEYKDAELTQEVLEKFNWYYLNIFITNNINGRVFIVDGQQRLSTLTLIATKLYHLTEDHLLKDTLKECIYGSDRWKGNVFRLDHEKRHNIMEKILNGDNEAPSSYKNKTEETLWNRYNDISKYIDDKDMDSKKLNTFVNYFLERLVLVELTITKDDTPMIFEVINDRGEALKPFEILKGKLVGALDKNDTERYSDLWDKAMSRLFGMEDAFFVDYLRSRFIFKRNSKIESAINNAYHRYIFENNDIGQSLAFRKTDKNQIVNIKGFIGESMPYYSKLYARIRNNELKDEFLSYLSNIHDLKGHFAIILSACEINDIQEDEKIRIIAQEYDRLYMLLRLNGVYDSNSFQEISFNLSGEIHGKTIAQYRELFDNTLKTAIGERRNKESISSLLDYATFKSMGYHNIEKRALRYFLARVEKYICDGLKQNMKDSVEYISTKTGYRTGYHIEHILSHNETNRNYFNSDEEFETSRNQLGDLLLLKDQDNISSGNEEYADKLKTYSVGLVWGHTLVDAFHHINKELAAFNNELYRKCGNQICPIDVFDKDALERRNKLLYDIVKIIWEID
ncbi:MAG: DUF262 domain-containing protein [Bacteroidales bacterium]|nr:DUF262 domain-containing protein [Bacteroidales bacterium]